MTVQNKENGTEMAQNNGTEKSSPTGKDHVNYWRGRLEKRTFLNDGQLTEVPEWQIRLAHNGKRGWVNLQTEKKETAAAKAREVFQFLRSNGWEATRLKYKSNQAPRETLTVDQFIDLYREILPKLEYPPRHHTAERYVKCLAFICKRVRVSKIADLTPDKVKDFKDKYRADGAAEKRDPESIKVSCNSMLRNAAGLFNKDTLPEYRSAGLNLTNPFTGLKLRRIELAPYSPVKRELLDTIWRESAMLRDGDPSAPECKVVRTGGRKAKKAPGEKAKRWTEPDWRQPHPEAYTILLLELGLGLRRHEADKAQKDWLYTDANGVHFIKVQETPYFKPKSKERRIIRVEPVLFEAVQKMMNTFVSPFIVQGRLPKRYEPGKEPKNIVYRCDRHHRALAIWLRKRGITDDKPCHLLRKEFGSYVATAFNLFAAQRLLGHSSYSVTERYYAGLTEQPELSHAKIH